MNINPDLSLKPVEDGTKSPDLFYEIFNPMRKKLCIGRSISLAAIKFDIFSCVFLEKNLQASQVFEIGLLHFHKTNKIKELILLSESICVVFYRAFEEENALEYPFNRSSSFFEDSAGKSGLRNCATRIPQNYKTE